MIRYLLDEVHFLEGNHSDAMRPVQLEPGKSLLGEEKEQRFLTFGDAKDLFSEYTQSLVNSLTQVISANLAQSSTVAPTSSNAPPVASTSTLPASAPSGSSSTGGLRKRQTDIGQFPVAALPLGLKIPKRDEGPRWWLDWVRDWENPDESNGLFKALKDWPEEWRTGRLRGRFGKLWSNRRCVAVEYIE
jgi:hypothetical protein